MELCCLYLLYYLTPQHNGRLVSLLLPPTILNLRYQEWLLYLMGTKYPLNIWINIYGIFTLIKQDCICENAFYIFTLYNNPKLGTFSSAIINIETRFWSVNALSHSKAMFLITLLHIFR